MEVTDQFHLSIKVYSDASQVLETRELNITLMLTLQYIKSEMGYGNL